MEKYLVYLKVKPFIRQWLTFHYGDPVVFPAQSVENATIRRFLTPQPKDAKPQPMEEGEVAVCLPDSKQKPVVTYNHLGKYAKAALVECIEDTFKLQMWKELNDIHTFGCPILRSIQAWCENNGISIDYDFTIRMRYQRMRNAYLKNGIDLRDKHRTKDD